MVKIMKNAKLIMLKGGILLRKKDGFGMNELLGTAATLIIAAFIIIPGLKDFAGDVMRELGEWWDNAIVDTIFPVS